MHLPLDTYNFDYNSGRCRVIKVNKYKTVLYALIFGLCCLSLVDCKNVNEDEKSDLVSNTTDTLELGKELAPLGNEAPPNPDNASIPISGIAPLSPDLALPTALAPVFAGLGFGNFEHRHDRDEKRFCGDDFPKCEGICPAGQTCQISGDGCECIAGRLCGGTAPACGGACPIGEACGVQNDSCLCLATPLACTNAAIPSCGGECPTGSICEEGLADANVY